MSKAQCANTPDIVKSVITRGMPSISACAVASLDKPLTVEELGQTIKTMNPVPDGLTLLYYKSFLYILAQYWMSAYNAIAKGQILSP